MKKTSAPSPMKKTAVPAKKTAPMAPAKKTAAPAKTGAKPAFGSPAWRKQYGK